MMWELEPRKILVGIQDGNNGAALAFAARESRLRGCGVHLVHVVPVVAPTIGVPSSTALINGELHEMGRKIVAEAATQLEHLLGPEGQPVSTEVYHGQVGHTLMVESAHASLVVLQHRGMGSLGRPPLLSVTIGVAARAHAPLVAVPAGWAEPDPGTRQVVTVGLGDDADLNDHLVDVAADEAARLGATLHLVHANDHAALTELVHHLPPEPSEYVETASEPEDALLAQAPDTNLFVVGRPYPHLPLGHYIGHATRALLRRSPVPVMVVDPLQRERQRRDLSTVTVP